MTTIWRSLAQSWPLGWPRARLRDELGAAAVDVLERSGLARVQALKDGDAYPCRANGGVACAMVIVDEGPLVAVCGLHDWLCFEEVLADEDAVRLHVDAGTLVPLLQDALGVPRRPAAVVRGVHPLGERRVGEVEARFVFVPRPARWVEDGWLERAVDEDPDRVLVVLVFDERSIPPAAPRRIRGTRVAWVALSQALDPLARTVDLADLWLTLAPNADLSAELWPRYAFTVDPARHRVCYAGRPLPLQRKPLEERLLLELLQRPGVWVPRRDLLLALWPEEFSARTREPKDPVALDRRLRQLKSALSAVFAELPALPGVRVDPIENLRTRGDLDGGYQVAVPPERVRWLSAPSE